MPWLTAHQALIAIVLDALTALACPFLAVELWFANRAIQGPLSWRFYSLLALIAGICLTRTVTVVANFTNGGVLGVLALSKLPLVLIMWAWIIGLRWDCPGGIQWAGLSARIEEVAKREP